MEPGQDEYFIFLIKHGHLFCEYCTQKDPDCRF
jgi:hypothetical protein